jgi:hypothetical protein
MARKLIFTGSQNSKTTEHELQIYANNEKEIFINIDMINSYDAYIILDKETAIELLIELNKQINLISEIENKNKDNSVFL